MMTAALVTATAVICGRCRTAPAEPALDQGFGYSREPDPVRPEPVPAGVDLYFFTGRTPRRADA
ncbi:hypothetical protein KZ829_23475 [Actinoplanes hulinensis]|uniref:Secreted protein n=1 Tax=Actinoplanes hulinensis TaxID=1144547 RepID=A0ABS7B733_9ACTN|nr:hypothetical protein [Actinoplanes hulinensis]MBW6436707.1 hypothetical protein [Actinoplanes hulinensis]